MALEDFADPEVGVAVAVTAVALSPQARGFVRRGLVFGLASVLKAGDVISGATRNVAQGAQQMASSTVDEARAEARGGSATDTPSPTA